MLLHEIREFHLDLIERCGRFQAFQAEKPATLFSELLPFLITGIPALIAKGLDIVLIIGVPVETPGVLVFCGLQNVGADIGCFT